MATELIAAPTADALRQRVINILCEPIRRVMQASDEAVGAWAGFKAERTPLTARRLNRAVSALDRSVNEYIELARQDLLADEDAINRLTTRVRGLEGALKGLVDESLQGDNRAPQPALQQALAVLRPARRA